MKLLPCILLFLAGAACVRADVSFNVEATRKAVPAEGFVELTVSAEWPQGTNTYVIYTPTMPQLIGVSVIDHVTFGQSLTVNSQIVQRMVHLFKLAVTNRPGEEAETGPIFIDYRPASLQEKQHRKLSGLTFTVSPPERKALKITVAAVGAALLLGGAVTLMAVRLSRKKKTVTNVQISPAIEDPLLQKLEQIRRLRIEGDIKLYFHELESLIKEYFRTKYRIGSVMDWSPQTSGRTGPDHHTMTAARELLSLSHNVCYAGYKPNSHDQDRMFDFLRRLLLHNRPHESLPEEELYLKQ